MARKKSCKTIPFARRRAKSSYVCQAILCCCAIKSVRSLSSVRPFLGSRPSSLLCEANSFTRDIRLDSSSLSQNNDKDVVRSKHEVKFVSPLLEEGYPPAVLEYESGELSKKPLLIYLPGFDGTIVAPFLQFPELGTIFDVRGLTIGMDDRSSFDQIKEDVISYILKEVTLPVDLSRKTNDTTEKDLFEEVEAVSASSVSSGGRIGSLWSNMLSSNDEVHGEKKPKLTSRSVYLMGESFGGILASDVALSILNDYGISNLKGMVLINPATCYDRSKLASEGPVVASLPKWFYPIGLLRLLPLFTDEYSFPQLLLLLRSKALPSVIDTPAREAYMGRVAFSLPSKLQYMPQETLNWRLEEWLQEGCARMVTRIGGFQDLGSFRTLIVAGEKDMTLPSIAEAERLSAILPNTQVHVVEGAGHASTCGSRVDLAALVRNCFSELRQGGGGIFRRGEKTRTSMKPEAAQGKGVYFGLEKRYNGEEVGLSPLLYWSKDLYRKWDRSKNSTSTQD